MRDHPDHPGAPHYLIHADDYTALAARGRACGGGLSAPRPGFEPRPTHAVALWSMLGAWDRSIDANRASSYLADPSSDHDRVKGDIVFEHAFNFIAYARLQRGEDRHVAEDLKALGSAAPLIVRARYALERGDWAAAAALSVPGDDAFDAALARFTRAYGAARGGTCRRGRLRDRGVEGPSTRRRRRSGEYWGVFVDIYAKAAEAWRLEALGKSSDALALNGTGRHAGRRAREAHLSREQDPPDARIPGRHATALGHPREALAAYRASLTLAPNRYRSLLGAATAAEASGDKTAARDWWEALVKCYRRSDKTRRGSPKPRRGSPATAERGVFCPPPRSKGWCAREDRNAQCSAPRRRGDGGRQTIGRGPRTGQGGGASARTSATAVGHRARGLQRRRRGVDLSAA